MATKDSSLYGLPRPKKSSTKEISSSTTLAFTSQLSSLIASSTSTTTTTKNSRASSTGRPRPRKEDIFSTHNKNTRKRALKDVDDADFTQHHSNTSEALDDATWHRSKRKMEEKARLYAAMKRGDVEDTEEKHMVDFDRKWAERHDRGSASAGSTSSDDDDDQNAGSDADEEPVEYTDEFGRTRRGTRAEAAREERRKKSAAADAPDRFTARPAAPTNIIYGDTVQTAAFNPDEPVAVQMAELAAKRDREATPPEEVHFDGRSEVRTKGVGFFRFSGDKDERERQMEALERERRETERARAERERRKEERRREIEERRKVIREKRGKVKAERFLEGLIGELGDGGGGLERDGGEGT